MGRSIVQFPTQEIMLLCTNCKIRYIRCSHPFLSSTIDLREFPVNLRLFPAGFRGIDRVGNWVISRSLSQPATRRCFVVYIVFLFEFWRLKHEEREEVLTPRLPSLFLFSLLHCSGTVSELANIICTSRDGLTTS